MREIETLNQQLPDGTVGLGLGVAAAPASRHVLDTDSLLVRLVNKMVQDAHHAGASDIHVEAYPDLQSDAHSLSH